MNAYTNGLPIHKEKMSLRLRLEEMYPRNDVLHFSIPDLHRWHKTSPAAVGLWFTPWVTCHRGRY